MQHAYSVMHRMSNAVLQYVFLDCDSIAKGSEQVEVVAPLKTSRKVSRKKLLQGAQNWGNQKLKGMCVTDFIAGALYLFRFQD